MTSDPIRRFWRAVAGFTAVVDATPADRWERVSPCAPWTARDVVAHVIDGQRRTLSLITGHGPTQPATDLTRLARHDPQANWHETEQTVLTVLREIDGQSLVPTGPGPRTVEELLSIAVIEPLVHAWDLAEAVDRSVVLDAEAVAVTLAGVRALGDQLAASAMYAPALPTDQAGTNPVDTGQPSSEQNQLLAATGRDPHRHRED